MSYALRNTLMLLVVLVLILGGGWAYIYFLQAPELERLQTSVSNKRTEYANKKQTADEFELLTERYEDAEYYIENYDKSLFRTSNEDDVFGYINGLNTGAAQIDFVFSFLDSTNQGQYGTINTSISGSGYYRNLVNLIRKIEYSKPINKISQLNISPINNIEDYGKVDFSFALESLYNRGEPLKNSGLTVDQGAVMGSVYNPFYPGIREVEPNTEGLINVENSNLVALSIDKIFLIDQSGAMHRLRVGDTVYLGKLEAINLQDRSASFRLNKGGIIEHVTLDLEPEVEE